MKLFISPVAPNPTKVALYLAERSELGAKIELEQQVVNLAEGENKTPDFLARNPFGKIPVLELDNGQHIFESLAIIEYLEEFIEGPGLWGDTVDERGFARNLERVTDVRVLDPATTYANATNSPIGHEASPVVAEHNAKIFHEALAWLNTLLNDNRVMLAGDRITVADCTLQASFQFLRFCGLEDLSEYPHVEQWSERYKQRPAAKQVLLL